MQDITAYEFKMTGQIRLLYSWVLQGSWFLPRQHCICILCRNSAFSAKDAAPYGQALCLQTHGQLIAMLSDVFEQTEFNEQLYGTAQIPEQPALAMEPEGISHQAVQ